MIFYGMWKLNGAKYNEKRANYSLKYLYKFQFLYRNIDAFSTAIKLQFMYFTHFNLKIYKLGSYIHTQIPRKQISLNQLFIGWNVKYSIINEKQIYLYLKDWFVYNFYKWEGNKTSTHIFYLFYFKILNKIIKCNFPWRLKWRFSESNKE